MRKLLFLLIIAGSSFAFPSIAPASGLETISLPASNDLTGFSRTSFKGRAAVRLQDLSPGVAGTRMMMLPVQDFHNGIIEAVVAGLPQQGSTEGARGFIGLAFRVQPEISRYEAFYIRPTNGRTNDQLRRNHATQYIAMPEYPWQRLRKENPGVYESYADMLPGEWIQLRIEVEGDKARLYVGGASQPTLIVNDLKLGSETSGGIALWIGQETEGYFADVKVTKQPD